MKSAIVTGSTSGIGYECTKKLLELGFRVYGLGRDFTKIDIKSENFIKVKIDLSNTKEIKKLRDIIDSNDLFILINSAGFGSFAPHEEMKYEIIEKMITVNLTAPLLISKLFLRKLKKNRGYIFNINSISGIKPAIFGATYGATKAALRHFGTSLFQEARKSGLKVININPDITKTPFFDDLNFKESDDPLSYIEPSCISNLIEMTLNQKDATVMTDIILQPQKFIIKKKH